jgi:hypothetical protein
MNLTELTQRNEKFQNAAAGISELLPGVNLLPLISIMIRSTRRIDQAFPHLLSAKSESRFYSVIDKLEEEMDEVVYALDRLGDLNRNKKIKPVNDFVKYGYDLLSVYSNGCDKIIEKRVNEELA